MVYNGNIYNAGHCLYNITLVCQVGNTVFMLDNRFSGDETLKPGASYRQDESISSDEENEASLDVSSWSDGEDERQAEDRDHRSEQRAAQVCAVH